MELGPYRALCQLGIPIERIISASVGALNGAAIGGGLTPAELAELWLRIDRHYVISLNWRALLRLRPVVNTGSIGKPAMRDRVEGKPWLRGELANRTGRDLETVRYYEKAKILPAPPRTAAGYRIYDGSHERRLRFILRARQLGFTIEGIRGLLKLVDGGHASCADVRDVTLNHLADLRAKIADLRRMEKTLAKTVAACDLEQVPECPVIDALNKDA